MAIPAAVAVSCHNSSRKTQGSTCALNVTSAECAAPWPEDMWAATAETKAAEAATMLSATRTIIRSDGVQKAETSERLGRPFLCGLVMLLPVGVWVLTFLCTKKA